MRASRLQTVVTVGGGEAAAPRAHSGVGAINEEDLSPLSTSSGTGGSNHPCAVKGAK